MFCSKINHGFIDLNRCLHRFIFSLIYKHAFFSFFSFLVCLSVIFSPPQNVATNGCLSQTSRIISQGYTCIFYFSSHFSSPSHIYRRTLKVGESRREIALRISHRKPFISHLPILIESQLELQIDKMRNRFFQFVVV